MYLDNKMTNENNVQYLRHIKEKYGNKKVRLLSRFYLNGLPEKFWFEKTSEVDLVKDQLTFVIGHSPVLVVKYCSLLAKKLMLNRAIKCRMVSFYELVFNLRDKFGRRDVFAGLAGQEFVIISDLVHSKIYADEHSNFIALINYLISNGINVVIGFQLSGEPKASTIRKAYGDLANFFDDAAIRNI